MMTRPLGADVLGQVLEAPLTYDEVGATYAELLPPGYAHLRQSAVIGSGRECFERAAEAVMRWEAQRGAGTEMVATDSPLREGTTVVQLLHIGPLRFLAPCRVVAVLEQPDRRGFAYGTLTGHPATGEERFDVRIDAAGTVVAEVTAFSRPARWYTRIGSPVSRLVQRAMVRRYLRALSVPAGAA